MKKKQAKKATVTMTTTVVDHTSSFDGQFTWRISTRTSWKKVPSRLNDSEAFPTGDIREKPSTRCCSSSRFNFAACAIQPAASSRKFLGRFLRPAPQKLAGEEGFEPPHPVLETG